MNGQSRDQASDSSDGSPGEPAFSQSTASSLHQRYMSFKSRETVGDQSDQKATQKLPPAGSIVLAVYETESEFRAGILLIHEVVETDTADSGCEFRNGPWTGSRYYSPSSLLTVAELQQRTSTWTVTAMGKENQIVRYGILFLKAWPVFCGASIYQLAPR